MTVNYLVSWDLVHVSLLLHQNDSLHGLVRVGVILGELSEARLAPERIRHCGERPPVKVILGRKRLSKQDLRVLFKLNTE